MSDAKSQQEPSMEEILASIRRIISEDTDQKPGAPAPAAAPAPRAAEPARQAAPAPMDDVLQLTDRLGDDGGPMSFDEPPRAQPAPMFGFDDPEDEPEPEREVEPDFGNSLMSRAAASASADAFSQLTRMSQPRDDEPRSPVDADTAHVLETLVKDTLRPILKEWLDVNLPPIVEELVRAEIKRVAGGRR